MSGFKVGDKYRTNELSLRPGGYTVIVEEHDGKRYSYDKIKYPRAYIRKVLLGQHVAKAWVQED